MNIISRMIQNVYCPWEFVLQKKIDYINGRMRSTFKEEVVPEYADLSFFIQLEMAVVLKSSDM